MNMNILEEKWEDIKNLVQDKWNDINDDELEKVKGNVSGLKDLIQEKMGYTEEEAKKAIQSVLDKTDIDEKILEMTGNIGDKLSDLKDEAGNIFNKFTK